MKKALTNKIITSEEMVNEELQHFKKTINLDLSKVSDGYHTFGELYDHRIQLFIVLCNAIYGHAGFYPTDVLPWKSKVHSDGTSWDGWFIAGIGREKGKQITYHLPIDRWDELRVVSLDTAPEFDGHTPADVIERLKKL